jgi:hypothetical protein
MAGEGSMSASETPNRQGARALEIRLTIDRSEGARKQVAVQPSDEVTRITLPKSLRRFRRNDMPARTIAVCDIHRCSSALDAIPAAVWPRPEDTLFTLGDDFNPRRDCDRSGGAAARRRPGDRIMHASPRHG